MSGAEFIAVLSIGASVIQVADACNRLIGRIQQFHSNTEFDELTSQLRLLSHDVRAISALHNNQGHDSERDATLVGVLQDCEAQIKKLDDLIAKLIPATNATSVKRTRQGFKAFARDREVQGTLSQLNQYKQALTLHLVVRNQETAMAMARTICLLEEKNRQLQASLETNCVIEKAKAHAGTHLQPAGMEVKVKRPKPSACLRGTYTCSSHRRMISALFSRCSCPEKRYSTTAMFLGKLISLDLDFVGQSTFSRSNISVKAINTVSKTSPGFMTLYHYSMGLLSGSEALAQLKTLGEQGSLSLQDIDQDGRNYVEVGHDPSYQSKRDFKWLTIC